MKRTMRKIAVMLTEQNWSLLASDKHRDIFLRINPNIWEFVFPSNFPVKKLSTLSGVFQQMSWDRQCRLMISRKLFYCKSHFTPLSKVLTRSYTHLKDMFFFSTNKKTTFNVRKNQLQTVSQIWCWQKIGGFCSHSDLPPSLCSSFHAILDLLWNYGSKCISCVTSSAGSVMLSHSMFILHNVTVIYFFWVSID